MAPLRSLLAFVVVGSTLVACGADDTGPGPTSTTGGGGVGGATSATMTSGISDGGSSTNGPTTNGSTSTETTTSSGGNGPCGEGTVFLEEHFDTDGAWPAPWSVAGGVATADVSGGRARWIPAHGQYPLARMKIAETIAHSESTFAVEFENAPQQGMGFYARQNGGYLGQTSPNGAGYAIFTAGVSNPPGIGAWFEAQGTSEVQLTVSPYPLASNTVYRVRVRVENESPDATRLRAKLWDDGSAEPAAWTVDYLDSSRPELQNVAAGFALDSWHNPTDANFEPLWIDDLVICNLD